MKQKKLLILGSDVGSLDVLREAHKMGVYVIVTDLMETSPTREAADETWNISTTDIDLLVDKCREIGVDGVLTGSSDFNISNSRKLCKKLGLPLYCESDMAWEAATNKSVFKKVCEEIGAPVATSYYISDQLTEEELDTINYPVVVKPVDKSGNRGMSYCKNKEELRIGYRNAQSVSDNSTIIVERQLHGPEFAVNYVIADGEIQLFYFSAEHNEPGEKCNLYSMIYTTYKHLDQYKKELNEKVIEVFKKLGCKEGLAWVECMLDDDGHFYLVEMGYRFGGEMTYVPYTYVCGFNMVKWMVEIAMGIKHKKEDLPEPLRIYNSTAASYHLWNTMDGEIAYLEGVEEISKLPNVFVDMPRRVGNTARFHSCMGVIRIFGPTVEELAKTIEDINKLLVCKDKDGNNLIIYYTDTNRLINDFNEGISKQLD